MSMGEAMREAGYSKAYSLNPNHLKVTNAWQELMQQQIPDELLATVHHGLLKHKDWRARDSGLEKGYKLKKRYGDTTIIHKFGELSDSELEAELARELSQGFGADAGEKEEAG